MARTVLVTGAFSYSGQYIARRFLEQGDRVRTLTRRPDRPHALQGAVAAFSLDFSDPAALVEHLRGVDVFVNTYWIRYNYPGSSFEQAVHNSQILLDCAKQAGVRRVVHISVSKPDLQSHLPYFRGKAQVEEQVKACGLSYAILRPTIVFGREEVLISNITWLLRQLPVFAVPGSGNYRVQPVFVEDLAEAVTEVAGEDKNEIMDVAGPEIFTFRELLQLLKRTVGSRAVLVPVPAGLALVAARLVSWVLGDIMLTRDELTALMEERLVVGEQAFGHTRFSEWGRANAGTLGRVYVNELRRHHGKGSPHA